jgi:DNA replication protein DnaC
MTRRRGLELRGSALQVTPHLNLDYDEWYHFLGNQPMVDALLSRIRHFCTTVRIDGPSLREPQK